MQQFKTVSASVTSVYPISAITHPRQDRIQCSAYPYHLNMRMLAEESFYFPRLHRLIEKKKLLKRKTVLGVIDTLNISTNIVYTLLSILSLVYPGFESHLENPEFLEIVDFSFQAWEIWCSVS